MSRSTFHLPFTCAASCAACFFSARKAIGVWAWGHPSHTNFKTHANSNALSFRFFLREDNFLKSSDSQPRWPSRSQHSPLKCFWTMKYAIRLIVMRNLRCLGTQRTLHATRDKRKQISISKSFNYWYSLEPLSKRDRCIFSGLRCNESFTGGTSNGRNYRAPLGVFHKADDLEVAFCFLFRNSLCVH